MNTACASLIIHITQRLNGSRGRPDGTTAKVSTREWRWLVNFVRRQKRLCLCVYGKMWQTDSEKEMTDRVCVHACVRRLMAGSCGFCFRCSCYFFRPQFRLHIRNNGFFLQSRQPVTCRTKRCTNVNRKLQAQAYNTLHTRKCHAHAHFNQIYSASSSLSLLLLFLPFSFLSDSW